MDWVAITDQVRHLYLYLICMGKSIGYTVHPACITDRVLNTDRCLQPTRGRQRQMKRPHFRLEPHLQSQPTPHCPPLERPGSYSSVSIKNEFVCLGQSASTLCQPLHAFSSVLILQKQKKNVQQFLLSGNLHVILTKNLFFPVAFEIWTQNTIHAAEGFSFNTKSKT